MNVSKYVVLLALGFVSCSSPRVRTFDPDLCSQHRGYEAGYSDGKDGYDMDSAFLSRCREDLRAESQLGYREGWEKGHAEYEKRMAEWRASQAQAAQPKTEPSAPKNNGTIINVNLGGRGDSGGDDRTWFCEISAFTKKFEGWGRTQLEAARSAQANCTRQYHSMHCDDPECQMNR